MRTIEEIRAANPNLGKHPVPIFENTDESAMTKALDNRQTFRETFNEISHLLPPEDSADVESN